MTRTSKMPRYNEYNSFANCFGSHQEGNKNWKDYFNNDNPIHLELGCGKAEVSLALARKNPDMNYIGVDLKSDRMWRAAVTANTESLKNIAFIQTDIRLLRDYFGETSIAEIWITFPDPFPRKKQAKHRMTGKSWLDLYKTILNPGGLIRFKHDDPTMFQWSLERFVEAKAIFHDLTFDLHESEGREDAKTITTYETRWLKEGKPTQYVEFSF